MSYVVLKSYNRSAGYFIRILIALDELGAVILKLPNNVTISSACGKWKSFHGFPRLIARIGYFCLDWMKPGHCEAAIINDESRDAISKIFLEGK